MSRKHVFERDPAEMPDTIALIDRIVKESIAGPALDYGPGWATRRCGCGGSFRERYLREAGVLTSQLVSCRCRPNCLYHYHQGLEHQEERRNS